MTRGALSIRFDPRSWLYWPWIDLYRFPDGEWTLWIGPLGIEMHRVAA